MMTTPEALTALSALAQESRLAIYRYLVTLGPAGMAATKIGEELGIPSSSVSFHLKELTHAALIKPRQESRFIIYAANFEQMNSLISFLNENCCGGNPCTPIPQSRTSDAALS